MLYAEFHYHKMASVNSLLVIVLLLAAIFPGLIETADIHVRRLRECFPSERSCKDDGGISHNHLCRGYCKFRGKYAHVCGRLSYGCYGCKCYSSDIRQAPPLSQGMLERKPLLYIYHLLRKYLYLKKRRRWRSKYRT